MSTAETTPVETFPPGEFIKDELEARGWTQSDLAEILGRPLRLVNELIAGKRSITPETAQGLGQAFGTSAQMWLNLETTHQLARVRSTDDTVERKSRLYAKAPMKELFRRHWIESSSSIDVLEQQVLSFLDLASLDDEPQLAVAARARNSVASDWSTAQLAWFFRVKRLARTLDVPAFTAKRFDDLLKQLRSTLAEPETIHQVPGLLSAAGIRMLVVEQLAGTKIDGACLWLDKQSPVVAMSLRFDRIDCFWHTLMHELGHVKQGFVALPSLDVELVGGDERKPADRPEAEREADRFAAEYLVPSAALATFIAQVRKQYSKANVQAFATEQRVHPGIVVGQLHYKHELPYSHLRDQLVKVRGLITEAAVCDGWQRAIPQGGAAASAKPRAEA